MPEQPTFIFRTPEQDREFALLCGREGAKEAMSKIVDNEALMHITDEEIYKRFKGLKENTLRSWCRAGKLGRRGVDNKHWVTLSEVRNYLFQLTEKRKKR